MALFDITDTAAVARLRTSDRIAEADRRLVQSYLSDKTPIRDLEIAIRFEDGRRRNVLLSAEAMEIDGGTRLISSFVDITDRKATEMATRAAADRDVLTGLPNRGLFQTRLAQDIAAAAEADARVGLILLDLDGFKTVNDSLGHVAGDALLQEVARRLTAIAGPDDLVARLGGDEFVVITACDTRVGEPIRRVQTVIDAILATLVPPAAIAGRCLSLRASLGVALFPDHGRTGADLLSNADLALYAAKAAGRNQAAIFEPRMRATVEAGLAITSEIRTAIGEGRIVPFYQPKVCLASGAVIGFEALARWRHPERGVLGPDAFGIAFDDPEIGISVGTCIAARVACDIGGWLAAGLDPGRIFINLSTPQFAERDFSAGLLALFSAAGVPHARIGVEVTEMVLLGSHADRVSRVLEELHAAGVRVALDDFGTGYASLTHLKRFPVDEIKIDRSFVADVIHDANDAAIVNAVLQLGRSLGLDVTAEGVETAEQIAFLRAAGGTTTAQGYYFARPSPAEDVPALLAGQGVTFALPRLVDAA